MTTKRRTTKPVSEEFKALRKAVTSAKERGQSVVVPMYRAMDEDEKRAYLQSRSR